MRVKFMKKLFISIIVCQLAGVLGSIFTAPAIGEWYYLLNKPSFSPPNWVFAPAWILLYFLMGISLYLVWKNNWKIQGLTEQVGKKAWNPLSTKLWTGSWKEENVAAIFALQLILNALWSVIFFGLRMPGLAFFEILMLWFAILYTIINFYRISKTASYLLIPYILWVSFAAVLNFAVWMLN